jgi:3-hydroxy-9,10-secoandrosta-1,3,5(10)-triene-9,17-dione monooxygenase
MDDLALPSGLDRPSLDVLLDRARALFSIVRERAQEAESQGKLHDDTFARLTDAGFGRICAPVRFGGYGLGLDAAAEVVMEMARGCGSTGWITNLMTIHNFQAGMFPLEAQEEYFADGVPFTATASRGLGSTLTEVEGGVRLSGRWKYASGADFADWFIIMQPVPGCMDWLMIPRADVALQHDWDVAGLGATGSQDIVIDDIFVPKHRLLSGADMMAGTTPGRSLYDDPYLRAPFLIPAAAGISAAICGMVAGMVGEFVESAASRRTMSGAIASTLGYNHSKLAEAEVQLACAQHLIRDSLARVRRWGETQLPQDQSEFFIPRRDYSYAVKLLAQIAQNLLSGSGAGAAFRSNAIQRLARDVLIGSTHIALNWDDAAEGYGRARWNVGAA